MTNYTKRKYHADAKRRVIVSERHWWVPIDTSYNYVTIPASYDLIEYGNGPKYNAFGRLNWKPCHHSVSNKISGVYGIYYGENGRDGYQICRPVWVPSTAPVVPSGTWDADVVHDIVSQIDLNCQEAIMCYSGILQAIPLVGGAFKLTSILNRAGRQLSKSFKRKPFTTVVKQLISLDFIDRFVVGPMIRDAQTFLDASNYVVRVMNTAYERNSMPVGLQAERTSTISEQNGSSYKELNNTYLHFDWTRKSVVVSKAFAKLQLHYDTNAIDPIKLWATRCGITRPLESAWDLVPFSFVIDYFTRAGDFIGGLSDEISRQGALSGRITAIHDLWGSVKASNQYTVVGTTATSRGYPYNVSWMPSTQTYESYDYLRFPIADPGTFLNLLEQEESFFKTSLSLTQLRTIAQLIIQAKL